METVTVQKKKVSDSDQTIAEVRELRWKLSKEYKTWEDIQRLNKEVERELKKRGIQFQKVSK